MADKDSGLFALVAYILGLLGIIIYFLKKEDKFVRFHAMQAFLLSLVGIVMWILTFFLFGLGGMLVWLYGIYIGFTKAYQNGEMYKIPYIGEYAEKYSS